MSGTSDKIKGKANETLGKVETGLGNATGSQKLKTKGLATETEGKVQKAKGEAKDALDKKLDKK